MGMTEEEKIKFSLTVVLCVGFVVGFLFGMVAGIVIVLT